MHPERSEAQSPDYCKHGGNVDPIWPLSHPAFGRHFGASQFRSNVVWTEYSSGLHVVSMKLLNLIVSLKDREFDETVYADRAALLSDLFAMTRREPDSGICMLDLDDSVSNLRQLSLPNAPSLYKSSDCQQCGSYAVPVSTINIDSQSVLFYRQNFTVLQQAVEFYPTLKKLPCTVEDCKRMFSINCHANFHIFINLEIKMRERSQKTMQCKLREIPTSLTRDMTYRLAEVIAHSQEGFVAYCYRRSESTAWWELYSSYLGGVKSPDPGESPEWEEET
ncbi:uncharacterized protein LOC114841511 [Diachasma alloeum]|uniref:uncharacterized protein LOC114841511 n=1 Tax=Diachasma alloeum TaxID=454923 RepID=UPI0010FB67E3|nr:uncharacterized protein LOC114841511 [Diachasma alloeum]